MMWLALSLEIMYVSLLLISCTLLSVQLCIRACCPSTQRWGWLLNAFAAIFTVLGGTAMGPRSATGSHWFPFEMTSSLLSSQVCWGWWVT